MSGFADILLRKTRTESEARGEARDKAEGKTEEMQANIRSMQKNGLSAETIAQYLNKSIDVVRSFMLQDAKAEILAHSTRKTRIPLPQHQQVGEELSKIH